MARKIIRLTESDLNRLVKRIAEDFEDEWPQLSGDERHKNAPSDEWWQELMNSGLSGEDLVKKAQSDPKWQEWQQDIKKGSEYDNQRELAHIQYKPSEEIEKLYNILDIPHSQRKYIKTRREMISYIKREEESLARAKEILGI